jgi:hypothetical protein
LLLGDEEIFDEVISYITAAVTGQHGSRHRAARKQAPGSTAAGTGQHGTGQHGSRHRAARQQAPSSGGLNWYAVYCLVSIETK